MIMRSSSRTSAAGRGLRSSLALLTPAALAVSLAACGVIGDESPDPSPAGSPSATTGTTPDPDSGPSNPSDPAGDTDTSETALRPSESGSAATSGSTAASTTSGAAAPGADFAAAVAGSSLADPFTAGLNVAGYQGWVQFQTPSGRIYCAVSDGTTFDGTAADAFIRCDISDATYVAPQRPADCEFDYGYSFGLSPKRAGELLCVSDVALLGEARPATLEYGERVELGGFICISAQDGVRCANSDYSHGFRVSRASYELY